MTESSSAVLQSSLSPFDTPLKDPNQDLLGRSHFARGLAQGIFKMDAEHGFVVALHGPWGSGKSTTLNFVLHYIEKLSSDDDKPIVVRFNPWWFAGQEQMLTQFFGQMRSAFKKPDIPKQLRNIGLKIERFAALLTPLSHVPLTSGIAGSLNQILAFLGREIRITGERGQTDVLKLRENLDQLLAGQTRKVLVVIDDIDRLSAVEIRLMFQLIKAVANFPKTIYLLAFARDVVARALDDVQPGHGEAYLEKIVQVPFNLPLPRSQDLHDLFFTHLQPILQDTPDEFWNRTYWGNVFFGIAPLLRNLRDVKRLLNSLQISYPMVRGEVNAVDFVAIESLRVFVLPMWNIVRDNPSVFAGSADLLVQYDPRQGGNLDAKRELLSNLLKAGTTDATREATHNLLYRLFPLYASAFGGAHYSPERSRTWRRQRQIRSPEVFPFYFQLAVEEGAMTLAEFHSILATADDVQAFTGELERLAEELMPDGQTSRIYEFMSHLEDLAHESELLPHERIPSVVRAIYDAGDSLLKAKLQRKMFSVPKEWRLNFLIHGLLFRLAGEEQRFQVLSNAFAQAKSVAMISMSMSYLGREYGKFEAGSHTPADKTVNEEHLAELEGIVLKRIELAERDSTLGTVPILLHVLYVWEGLAGSPEQPRYFVSSLVQSNRGMIDFLSSCLQERLSSGMSDRVAESRWIIKIPTVEKWTDPYQLQDRAQSLLQRQTHWLADEKILALEVFLRDLEQAPGGYDDFNQPKPNKDTEPEAARDDPSVC